MLNNKYFMPAVSECLNKYLFLISPSPAIHTNTDLTKGVGNFDITFSVGVSLCRKVLPSMSHPAWFPLFRYDLFLICNHSYKCLR